MVSPFVRLNSLKGRPLRTSILRRNMPVKFPCDHCDHVLKVSTSKIGKSARCPKCNEKFKIPTVEEGAAALDRIAEAKGSRAEDADESEDPFSEFTVYDEDPEVVYEFESDPGAQAAATATVDHGKIAVSRTVLYSVGVVQIVIAIVFFIFGIIVGMDLGSSPSTAEGPPSRCIVTGVVEFQDADNQTAPDPGAVVIALPVDSKPDLENKANPDGLHPESDLPDDDNRGLWTIRELGGDYARTNGQGQFNLQVSSQQAYYVLYISKSMFRTDGDSLSSPQRASLGSYFSDVNNLLGENQFRWDQLTIRNTAKKDVGNIVFQ